MKVTHLTEEVIQQYVLDKAGCEPPVMEHIQHCAHCQAIAAAYEAIYTGVKEAPKATFEFDVTKLVMAQLPQPVPVASHEKRFMFILAAAVVAALGITGYWLRHDLAFLFDNLSSLLTMALLTAIITMAVCHVIDLYRRYQRKMHALDLY
jgi:anti-sigma factor RsiW